MDNEMTPQDNFMSPVIPAMFGNSMPIMTPQLPWEKGVLPAFFHNVKLRQRERAAQMEANIAIYAEQKFNAGMNMIERLTTHSDNLRVKFAENQHKVQMMELEKYQKQQEVQQAIHTSKIMEQQVKQEELKTMTMDVELKTADLTFQRMRKEMENDSAT
jgi:hypothetical protein